MAPREEEEGTEEASYEEAPAHTDYESQQCVDPSIEPVIDDQQYVDQEFVDSSVEYQDCGEEEAIGNNLVLSDDGFNFVVSHEGVVTHMYNDSAGHCTIGVGHLIHYGNCDGRESEKPYKNGITKDQAFDLFRNDLAKFEAAINDIVKVPLTQYQYDALVSFVYNIGSSAFAKSGVLRELNSQNYSIVPSKMMEWVKPPELRKRRTDEASLFGTGSY